MSERCTCVIHFFTVYRCFCYPIVIITQYYIAVVVVGSSSSSSTYSNTVRCHFLHNWNQEEQRGVGWNMYSRMHRKSVGLSLPQLYSSRHQIWTVQKMAWSNCSRSRQLYIMLCTADYRWTRSESLENTHCYICTDFHGWMGLNPPQIHCSHKLTLEWHKSIDDLCSSNRSFQSLYLYPTTTNLFATPSSSL